MAPKKVVPPIPPGLDTLSNPAAVKKRNRYNPVRRFDNGLLNAEGKSGKHGKLLRRTRSFPVLRLPPEIRNMIWDFALGGSVFPARVYTGATIINQRNWRTGKKTAFPLLHTCRQIYAEAALIPYYTNIFNFNVASTGGPFHVLPFVGQQTIGAVHFYVSDLLWNLEPFEKANNPVSELLSCEDFPSLRRVVIHVKNSKGYGPVAKDLKAKFAVEAQKFVERVVEKREDIKVVFLQE